MPTSAFFSPPTSFVPSPHIKIGILHHLRNYEYAAEEQFVAVASGVRQTLVQHVSAGYNWKKQKDEYQQKAIRLLDVNVLVVKQHAANQFPFRSIESHP